VDGDEHGFVGFDAAPIECVSVRLFCRVPSTGFVDGQHDLDLPE
jgi:hypothetical protein